MVGTAELVPLLVVLAFIQASIGTFFNPARGALVPRIVPPEGLLAANSISQATRVIAGVISGAGGPHRRRRRSPGRRSLLDAVTFLVSAAIVLRVAAEAGRPSRRGGRPSRHTQRAGEGLRIVAGSRLLYTTLLALASRCSGWAR